MSLPEFEWSERSWLADAVPEKGRPVGARGLAVLEGVEAEMSWLSEIQGRR
jgi:hypothetical protein